MATTEEEVESRSVIVLQELAVVRRFREEGALELASGNHPFLLDDKHSVWLVDTGKVEIFTVGVKGGQPIGARTHFLSVPAGHVMFGMDLAKYGMGNGFLAVGRMGTSLRRLPTTRLQQLAAMDEYVEDVATLMDIWIAGLSKTLTRDIIPGPLVDVNLAEGQDVTLENQQKARSNKGVLWLSVKQGGLLFIGMEPLFFEGRAILFPVSSDTWIEASNDQGVSTSFKARPSDAVVAEPATWSGLDLFHRALCQCEFINKKLATVDEFNRLKSKAEYSQAAQKAALRNLASVLEQPAGPEADYQSTDDDDSIFQACRVVGESLGMTIKRHPAPRLRANQEERIAEVAKASRFRTRVVALRDDWWNHDQGPLVGQYLESKSPVALVPTSPSSYDIVDPKANKRQKMTEEISTSLAPFALTFYRPFPDGKLSVMDLVKFGMKGLSRDLFMLLVLGLTMGAIGTLTPYATGQIFDQAIPQAEKGLLIQFTVALFVAAITSGAFKIAQSVAVIRIQGKMDYSIQAALWDRLLNLPATFFREYASGDLADRASGVNKIRDLVAGAGVAAILGMLTSVFYLGMLFKYSMAMAMLSVALTIVFVGFTTAMNFMQLRYQRQMAGSMGKITGMVLQLISGVGKLRVSGAENHAFRVWAERFAEQRRISFKAERIQNHVAIFNSSFAIFASMAIFLVLVMVQTKAKAAGAVAPGMTTGDFIAFSAAFGLFVASIQALSDASLSLLGIVPIYERLKPIITTQAESDESKAYPGKLTGEIEISHVHFRYAEDGPWILKDVTMKIQPGEFVAFVGGSGSGKSTMMRLMLGFETPEKGTLYYDGQDLNTLDLREVRQQLGVVLQSSRVLPTDIFRNITGTSSLTIEDAWDAARAAGLAEDIEQMPMGMHTYVAEGGGGFSGGQKQRLLIARAVVNKPRVIFLDEATSALDNRTQAIVTESMNKMQATRIVIAHRLSTIIHADRICVLEAGVIKEMGNFQELMKLDGLFATLAKRQIA